MSIKNEFKYILKGAETKNLEIAKKNQGNLLE